MIQNILISGAGIAGPTLSYFLSLAGIQCTIIETAPSLPTAGQQIDIRGAALTVVQRMGLESTIRNKSTHEQGLHFIDSTGKARASFPVDEKGGRSFSSDIEILRGELAEILVEANKTLGREGKGRETEYIFGDRVTGLEDKEDGVLVSFANAEARTFDLVIAADGMRSSTRALAFPQHKTEDILRSLGMYTCYFTIPGREDDGEWAKWYNAPGRRCILARPDMKGSLRTYLSVMSEVPAEYHKRGVQWQKKTMREVFADAGWQSERMLDGMDQADDFYMQQIAQVKMDRWSQGRVAVVGDAGYCPSPISGVGTSLAIVGAYVLAGEIVRHRDDHEAAFEAYERKMRDRVSKAQALPPGAPALANPETWWGIRIMLAVLSVAAKTNVASWFAGGPSADEEFEEYQFEKTTSN